MLAQLIPDSVHVWHFPDNPWPIVVGVAIGLVLCGCLSVAAELRGR